MTSPVLKPLLSLWVCLCAGFASAQTSSFEFLQKPGPYPVGLRVVHQYDHSRPYPGSESGRPLQTLIWYPAQNTGTPVTVADYVRLVDTEIHFNTPDEKGNKWRARLKTNLNKPLWSLQDAKPAAGRYPILIYAPSDSSVAWENADLCEYLASYGYIVLASPSMGTSTRDMTDDLDGLNTQARDISFLITYAITLPDTDSSKIAVLSWSLGGISSLFAAARDPRMGALVELDGTMRYYPGLVQRAPHVHAQQMAIPLLFFAQGDASLEMLDKDDALVADKTGPSVLNAWTQGDLLIAHMLGMSHPEFSSMTQRRKDAASFAEDQVADYGRDDANTGYSWVSLYTLNFLDAYLKHNATAKAFLQKAPAQNGVPKHILGITFRSAQKLLPAPAK